MNNNKKILLSLFLLCTALTVLSAAKAPDVIYISPNNDGIQDELVIPLNITDKRYIQEWSFVITAENGTVVRTIANKEKRPDRMGIKEFFKALVTPKTGVTVPDTLRWNGVMDSGETAPDGVYYYYVTATDDNGNVSRTPSYKIIVDNTPPEITLETPENGGLLIFSPDGDGNKDTITFDQTGSVEKLWTGAVKNADGVTVKTVTWADSAPAAFVWDGKNDLGTLSPDGIYSYTISSTDQAGNSTSRTVNNIILSTIRPSINISIDTNAFSPDGNGVKDTVQLITSVPVTSGLVSWKLSVTDREGSEKRTYSGASAVPPSIPFDGKDDSGRPLPEGDYQAVLSAAYVNGYEPVANSPYFSPDVTPPYARVRAGADIFTPNGDGNMDTIQIAQEASDEQLWTGTITDKDGKTVKTYTFSRIPPATITWDGMGGNNTLMPDGVYSYRLSSTDKAGNTGVSNAVSFELNTENTPVILTANLTAFSPNGDSVKDSVVFSPVINAKVGIDSYTLTVTDETGTAVRTFKGTRSVPASIPWNGLSDSGTRVPDGSYTASLEVTYQNGNTARSSAPAVAIDTVFPSVEIEAPYLVFSPNGDGIKDTLILNLKTSNESVWTARISDAKNNTVREYRWEGEAEPFEWDATDEEGNRVPDGDYTFEIQAEDAAGNRTSSKLGGITVDAREPKVYLTAALSAFSPNGDGIKDVQKLSVVTTIPEGIASWEMAIVPEDGGAPVKVWTDRDSENLPAAINWDGKTDSGTTAEGRFTARLTVTYVKGDTITVSTPPFISSVTPPQLTVRMSPEYFSPDNDGVDDDLFISLKGTSAVPITSWSFEINDPENGSSFWKTGGSGTITERLVWDGRSNKGELVQSATDYPFVFTVTDTLGMTSTVTGIVPIDVLVIRVGDVLKIQVPSIIFRKDAADFEGLAPEVVEKNTFVLRRIAGILNKFKDYKVTIEGHANNVTGTEREEINELIPLSEARANAVRDILQSYGVDGGRLSTVGVGGRQPVAAREDRDNWWKNRRVEFILVK